MSPLKWVNNMCPLLLFCLGGGSCRDSLRNKLHWQHFPLLAVHEPRKTKKEKKPEQHQATRKTRKRTEPKSYNWNSADHKKKLKNTWSSFQVHLSLLSTMAPAWPLFLSCPLQLAKISFYFLIFEISCTFCNNYVGCNFWNFMNLSSKFDCVSHKLNSI